MASGVWGEVSPGCPGHATPVLWLEVKCVLALAPQTLWLRRSGWGSAFPPPSGRSPGSPRSHPQSKLLFPGLHSGEPAVEYQHCLVSRSLHVTEMGTCPCS